MDRGQALHGRVRYDAPQLTGVKAITNMGCVAVRPVCFEKGLAREAAAGYPDYVTDNHIHIEHQDSDGQFQE